MDLPHNGTPPGGPSPDGLPPDLVAPGNSTISDGQRLFGALSYLIFVVLSLAANILLLGRKQFKTMPFFIIAWQMLLADFVSLFAHIILHVPITFANRDLYGETFMYAIGYGLTISFNAGFFFVFLLTINRFLVFVFPKINNRLFTSPNIYILIGITWLFSIGFSAGYGVSGCTTIFSINGFHTYLMCNQNRSSISYTFQRFENYMAMYIPIIMMGVYLFLFLEIRFQVVYMVTHLQRPNKVVKNSKREILILIQSVLLCGVFELENVILAIMPSLRMSLTGKDNNLVTILTFSQAWIEITCNTIHAIVIFLFNSLAKEVFYVMIGKKKQISFVVSKQTAVIKVQPALQRSNTVPLTKHR